MGQKIQGLFKNFKYHFQIYSCDILPHHNKRFWHRYKNNSDITVSHNVFEKLKFKYFQYPLPPNSKTFSTLFGFQKLYRSWKKFFQGL